MVLGLHELDLGDELDLMAKRQAALVAFHKETGAEIFPSCLSTAWGRQPNSG